MLENTDEGKGALMRLLAAYLLWNAAGVLGGSFFYLYFKDAGITLAELVVSFLFWAGATPIVIRFLDRRRLDMRGLLLSGVAVQICAYLLMTLMSPTPFLIYFVSFLFGMNCFLFWVPFNIMYFELGRGREAMLGSLYFAINPLFGVFLPLIGGALAASYGFASLFALATATYALIIPFAYLAFGIRSFRFDIKACLSGLKGFKTLMTLEGVYGGVVAAAMGVIAVYYFTKPAELGVYLSVTTVFSVLASFVVSRLSDKSRKRGKYISLSGSALGVATALLALATNSYLWSAAVSARNFFANLFYPFTTAIVMDNRRESMEDTMVGREFLLNYGRFLGIALVLGCLALLGDIHLSLALAGLVILAYPAVIALKRRHITVE